MTDTNEMLLRLSKEVRLLAAIAEMPGMVRAVRDIIAELEEDQRKDDAPPPFPSEPTEEQCDVVYRRVRDMEPASCCAEEALHWLHAWRKAMESER